MRPLHIPALICLACVCVAQVGTESALAADAVADQAGGASGVRGIPRADRNSKLAHEQLLAKAKKGGIDLYFEGDSITRRWGTSDGAYRAFLANWKENFHGWNAGNFGWGGDTVQNILWRLENGELDGVHPKVIVLLGGTNNVGSAPLAGAAADAKVAEVTAGIGAILDVMRRKAPEAVIVVTGVTPRNDGRSLAATKSMIERINLNLSKRADGQKVRFININNTLADQNGRLAREMTVDGLHFSVKGYQVWADALRPILTELLGPRGTTDHAPEPTGDPSARGR